MAGIRRLGGTPAAHGAERPIALGPIDVARVRAILRRTGEADLADNYTPQFRRSRA